MKSQAHTLTEQLAARYGQRIRDRLLAPGARLPSVRQCAAQQGVSPSTVVAAYEMLLAQGLVEARRNRGFFVRERAVAPGAAPSSAAPVAMRAPVNATALIRGMFQSDGGKPQPSMGVLPQEWLRCDPLAAVLRRHCSPQAVQSWSLRYGEPAGDPHLRQVLVGHLAELAVPAHAEQIITTVGATQALDIVSRTLLQAGDHVMVEEPGWTVEFARLQAQGLRVLPVPRRADGPDLAVMEQYCANHRPKLFVSVSVLHNPTGYCLAPHAAHALLQLAGTHGFYIVEDDTYSHFAPGHATRMCALDALQRTIYVGGFAKVLAPNWRVGFLAAPPPLVERLLDTKLLSSLTTPALLERALADFVGLGLLRRHAERIRLQLESARARSVRMAIAHGCRFVSEPAGMFGWVDTGTDTDALAQRMIDEGYLIAPGGLFHAQRAPGTLMRINFTTTQEPAFWHALQRQRAAAGDGAVPLNC